MKGLSKINAGAIQYVLVLSVIIIIVLFAFISLIFLQKKTLLKSDLYKATIHSTYLSFDHLNKQDIPYDSETKVKFSELEYEDTRILKKHWGLFDLAIVTSNLKNEKFQKIALLGNHNKNRKAVYLKENNQPLVLVGNTKITGDVSLPKRGVKTGNIAGTAYYGSKLVYGTIETNTREFPQIKNIAYLQRLIKDLPFEEVKYFNLEDDIKINQPFTEETLLFETEGSLSLRNMSLQGNVVVVSRTRIHIFPSAKLENIIIIAPEVIIESNENITCQIFASKRILVKENSKLSYPSSLTLMNDEVPNKQDENSGIQIKDGADVRGILLYHSSSKESSYNTQVLISEKATVTGEVYCNKNFELLGIVNGFVYTNSFIAKQFGGVYINHIYNGTINSESISEEYSGLFIEENNSKVIKWIE